MKFTYNWKLTDLKKIKKNGLKVFSCFACGGGSTMGYKMSGFEVVGCNEIDPEMIEIYKANHNPKHAFLEPIQEFKKRDDLPAELFDIDVLDGSPPCSSFSMAGSRGEDWGKKKKFREGQAEQVLDDLFFHFIDLAKKLRPKIVVAENVKGMLGGDARGYVKEIIKSFNEIGYEVQVFLLNGATMGLPQKRERVFFLCRRKDLKLPKISLEFNEPVVTVGEAFKSIKSINYKGRSRDANPETVAIWNKIQPGQSFKEAHPKGYRFNEIKLPIDDASPTIPASNVIWHYETPRNLSVPEFCVLGSFPIDYKFKSESLAGYQVGMSVPPLMMHKISEQIFKQWFSKRKKT